MKKMSFLSRILPGITALTLLTVTISAETGYGDDTKQKAETANVFKGPIGLALYSLRATISESFDQALDLAQSYGVKYVELYDVAPEGLSSEELTAKLADHDLVAIAAYFGYGQFIDDPEAVAVKAKELGVRYAGISWLPHEDPLSEEQVREAADVFNRAGKVLAEQGILFYFHNHGYEFTAYEDRTMFDLMLELTDPQYVVFEMDLLWVVSPGQDPVEFLRKYPGRFHILHLKDLRKDFQCGQGTNVMAEDRVVLGQGQMNYPEILRAAQETGVQFYLIEDETTDPLQAIPESIQYLESVRL